METVDLKALLDMGAVFADSLPAKEQEDKPKRPKINLLIHNVEMLEPLAFDVNEMKENFQDKRFLTRLYGLFTEIKEQCNGLNGIDFQSCILMERLAVKAQRLFKWTIPLPAEVEESLLKLFREWVHNVRRKEKRKEATACDKMTVDKKRKLEKEICELEEKRAKLLEEIKIKKADIITKETGTQTSLNSQGPEETAVAPKMKLPGQPGKTIEITNRTYAGCARRRKNHPAAAYSS